MRNFLLTGRRGVGKSTIIQKVLKELTGVSWGGFYTQKIFEKDVVIGFKICSFDGSEETFAHVNLPGSYRVGRFNVIPEVFERTGVAALISALKKHQLIIMDEIGTMERGALKFQQAVIQCLNSKKLVLGVIQQKPCRFLDSIRNRPDVQLVTVTENNREALPQILVKYINQVGKEK